MKKADLFLKWGVGVACLYESVAIASGATPTISNEVGRHDWLGPIILGGLALHFYWPHVSGWWKRRTTSA